MDIPLDVVYAIQMSRDLPSKLVETLKTFVINSLKTYKLSNDGTRVGLLQFPNDPPTVLQELNGGTNLAHLVTTVKNMKPTTGSRNVNAVVQTAINNMLWRSNGQKRKQMVVLALTETNDDVNDVELKSSLKKLDDEGIPYLVIYLGERDKSKLKNVIENPNQLIFLDPGRANEKIGEIEAQISQAGGECLLNKRNQKIPFECTII